LRSSWGPTRVCNKTDFGNFQRLVSCATTGSAVSLSALTQPWHKARTRRYETANGLARDIQRYLADEVVEARPPSAGYRVSKFVRRHKGPVIAASLVLLTLVGGIVGTTLALFEAWRQEQIARDETAEKEKAERREKTERRKAEASLYLVYFARANFEWKNGREDQARHFLSLCPEEPRGWEWYCLYRVCYSFNPSTLKHTPPSLA